MRALYIFPLMAALFAGCSAGQDDTPFITTAAMNADLKASNEAFLVANGKRDGVTTTSDGLEYKVIKSGAGATPKAANTVTVHYEGKLIDGTVFDSSIQRDVPASFPVTGVIPGWVEALQLMKVGDTWQLAIPAALAYGDKSPSPQIPAGSTLVFQVQLISIDK